MITCISDTYYKIGRWFTFIMLLISLITLPLALDLYDSVYSFLMCGGIAFVGVAADFKDKTEYPIHYTSALVSAASSTLWTAHVHPCNMLCLLTGALGIINRKRWLLWCEIGCFLQVIITILEQFIKLN